jgi:hypothetical protein
LERVKGINGQQISNSNDLENFGRRIMKEAKRNGIPLKWMMAMAGGY